MTVRQRPHGANDLGLWAVAVVLRQLHRQERMEAQRARAARAAAIRRPPAPPYDKAHGACRLCGAAPLPARRRSWCSGADGTFGCVDLWYVATSGDSALRHLVALHGHQCWTCGASVELRDAIPWAPDGRVVEWPVALFVDHVRPLWSLTAAQRLELRWWLPFNLQVLCGPCHATKTSREAALRAWLRRRQRQRAQGLPLEPPPTGA